MDSNDKTPEQKLKDAASNWALENADETMATNSALNRGFIAGAKSEAAKEYWSQSQSSEIERLRQELDFAKKDRDSLKAKWEANSCTVADLADEADQLKKFGETLKAEISSLKSQLEESNLAPKDWWPKQNGKLMECVRENIQLKRQLEAKAVDVDGLREKFEKEMCETVYINEHETAELVKDTFSHEIINWFKPFLQTGKSEAVEWNSENIIGRVRERHKELRAKGWDYQAFYNGWLEGRVDMLRINKGV